MGFVPTMVSSLTQRARYSHKNDLFSSIVNLNHLSFSYFVTLVSSCFTSQNTVWYISPQLTTCLYSNRRLTADHFKDIHSRSVIFTDIIDSTNKWDGSQTLMWQCVELHHQILRAQVARFAGFEIKSLGDEIAVSDAFIAQLYRVQNPGEDIKPADFTNAIRSGILYKEMSRAMVDMHSVGQQPMKGISNPEFVSIITHRR